MENFKLLFQLYYRPANVMSEIMDKGNWLFAAVAVLTVSFALNLTTNPTLDSAYGSRQQFGISEEFSNDFGVETAASSPQLSTKRRSIPLIGDYFFWLFSFNSNFLMPLIGLSVFYLPTTIFLVCLFGGIGSFGLVFRRDYGALAACALLGWTAAHLPFAIAGFLFLSSKPDPAIYLASWFISGLLFGILMVFALRTVFGVEYWAAIVAILISWLSFGLSTIVTPVISPWLFSPFFLIFILVFLGGFLRRELQGFGNSLRQKRDFKRLLQNATVNPNDADAHLQLGLIYAKRRQEEKAFEHFAKAVEIDPEEIDANYELGKIARKKGELQKAIEHFSIIVEQNDKYALSEIWREIGATYLDAGMLKEAYDPLEKFVARREFDAEGLYYFGKLLMDQSENERAKEMFQRAIEAVKTAPFYRRREIRRWSRLARKEF